jgi:hypothetical protein
VGLGKLRGREEEGEREGLGCYRRGSGASVACGSGGEVCASVHLPGLEAERRLFIGGGRNPLQHLSPQGRDVQTGGDREVDGAGWSCSALRG